MTKTSTIPQRVDPQSQWDAGISDYIKTGNGNEYAWGRSINFRSNPQKLSILPQTSKESGSLVLGLPVDGDQVGTDTYYYDAIGNIYKRTSSGSHSLLRTVANSHGNGMKYYAEDDYLYYTTDRVIGRYGQVINGTPSFVDDFLGSEGGIPLNTYALHLTAASSQYASRADTASLSITGDLSIEASVSPDSLPTVGNSMVLFSKWDVNSNKRSYKFEILAISGSFGDGSSSSLTISSNTTESPIDSACTGTSGTNILSATNLSFAAGQVVLIHQTQGGSVTGTQMVNKIQRYTAGTITLVSYLNATYSSGAQVRVVPQYTNVTINTGVTYTAKAWNGTTGGILSFLANSVVSIIGTITSSGKGFRGGSAQSGGSQPGFQGEGTAGAGGTPTSLANGNGGGGGREKGVSGSTGGGCGGQGANFDSGTSSTTPTAIAGTQGTPVGSDDLTTMNFGGAGGSGGTGASGSSGAGGNGGGIIFITGATFTLSGSLTAAGAVGSNGSGSDSGAGGGGGGGAILIKAQTATYGTSLANAVGGNNGTGVGNGGGGGNAGTGRNHLDYLTSFTGTTVPTLNHIQDNTLVTNTSYQLRLGLSSDGTVEEFLTKNFTPVVGKYSRVGVAWTSSTSTAEFMQEGLSLGTSVGAVTSLNDNTSTPAIGCDFNSTPRNFYDGLIDEVRVFNIVRTASQMYADKGHQIAANTSGLVAYYQLNGDYVDFQTSANNTLTQHNTPTFSQTVPFSDPTTRQDIDQVGSGTGDTYTLPTTIIEASTDKQPFTPAYDPQKSIAVNIDTIGSGNWTITVHDSLNRFIISVTVAAANLHTGVYEFVFSDVWTPIVGVTYHFHLTVSTGTSKVVTTTNNNLSTSYFTTYYQFLVTDTNFHPMEQILNLLAIGNGRYLATYNAAGTYNSHRLIFPAGWKVRSLALWNGFLAIGCWKYDDTTKSDRGIIFFWDGTSDTYNDDRVVEEGGVNAMFASRGTLYVWAGYHGDMLSYTGGQTFQVEKRVPKILDSEYMEILPKAVNSWDGMLRFGFGGKASAASVERGVYTFAKRKGSNPMALSFDYPISTGSRGTTVKIGWIFPVGRNLLIGWEDNASHGVDVVNLTASPFATATIEKNVKDYGTIYKNKIALLVKASFDQLNSGESIQVKYKLDGGAWKTSGFYTSASSISSDFDGSFIRFPIDSGGAEEIQIAADLATSGTTSPSLNGLTLEYDPLEGELGI